MAQRGRIGPERRYQEAFLLGNAHNYPIAEHDAWSLEPGQCYRESGEQMLALKPPTTRGTVLDLLSIGFARFLVIEEDPLVAPFGPPELSPQFVCLPARTI
jgi:hypothetical protein